MKFNFFNSEYLGISNDFFKRITFFILLHGKKCDMLSFLKKQKQHIFSPEKAKKNDHQLQTMS